MDETKKRFTITPAHRRGGKVQLLYKPTGTGTAYCTVSSVLVCTVHGTRGTVAAGWLRRLHQPRYHDGGAANFHAVMPSRPLEEGLDEVAH